MRRRQPRFLIGIVAPGRGVVDRNDALNMEPLLEAAFAGCADLHLG
jgi:hypothetical protein